MMAIGKTGAIQPINFFRFWVEIAALALLITGFVLSMLAGSAVVSYTVIFLCGMLTGRLWFRMRQSLRFRWFVIIISFVLGYVMGAIYGSRRVMLIMFVIGFVFSYYAHSKKMIKSV